MSASGIERVWVRRRGILRKFLRSTPQTKEVPSFVAEANPRPLSAREQGLLEGLLAVEFPGRSALLPQMEGIRGRVVDHEGSVQLKVEGEHSQAEVESRVPVEGEVKDLDGMSIEVLLHVVNGYLHELEVYRRDGGVIELQPSAEKMKVSPCRWGQGEDG